MDIRHGEHLSGFHLHKELMRAFYELHKRGLLVSDAQNDNHPTIENMEQIVPIWTIEIPPGTQN
jgi:hypothetical protein